CILGLRLRSHGKPRALRCWDVPTAVGGVSPPRKRGPRAVGGPVVWELTDPFSGLCMATPYSFVQHTPCCRQWYDPYAGRIPTEERQVSAILAKQLGQSLLRPGAPKAGRTVCRTDG